MRIKKGDHVWIETYDYRGILNPAVKTEVVKVGSRYIYVKSGWEHHRFYKDTLKSIPGFRAPNLYRTWQEYEDKMLHESLLKEVKNIFGAYGNSSNVTLEQLKKIKEILTPIGLTIDSKMVKVGETKIAQYQIKKNEP